MKTYSRQVRRVFRCEDAQGQDAPAVKRRRCNEDSGCEEHGSLKQCGSEPEPEQERNRLSTSPPTSSPKRLSKALISSDLIDPADASASPCATPPSSPPLLASRAMLTQPQRRRRQARTWSTALTDITNSTRTFRDAPGVETNLALKKTTTKRKHLMQTQLDLGGDIQKACKVCGMEYTPSNVEDVALHKKFHEMNVGGVDLGRRLTRLLRDKATRVVKNEGAKGDDREDGDAEDAFVVVVDRKSSVAEKNKAKEVLELVNTELSAISAGTLWNDERTKENRKPNGNSSRPASAKAAVIDDHDGQSVVLLFIKRGKCVGLCLAERITKAYKVLEDKQALVNATDPASKGSSISCATESSPALLGISRIWTSKSHRGRGIASTLLDHARHHLIYGIEVSKNMVAFSQPTESGGHLARRWFGETEEWLVYVDD